jgi:hypothetical protein
VLHLFLSLFGKIFASIICVPVSPHGQATFSCHAHLADYTCTLTLCLCLVSFCLFLGLLFDGWTHSWPVCQLVNFNVSLL